MDLGVDEAATLLRRCVVVEQMLTRLRWDSAGSRTMDAMLESLRAALGAEGAAVLDMLGDGTTPSVLYAAGAGAELVRMSSLALFSRGGGQDGHMAAPDGRPVLVCACRTRFGEQTGLALWRQPGREAWNGADLAIAGSAAALLRVVLEHEAITREMARQARSDPLTGLLNRRAFLDEATRRTDRLDREDLPATLMLVALDRFRLLNEARGFAAGDEALCAVAHLLREAVRPFDLVARLGGDEFALWLDGMDELTAAERAEMLVREGPSALADLGGPVACPAGLSIAIATRWPGRGEDVATIVYRADQIMHEIKRERGGQWGVWREQVV